MTARHANAILDDVHELVSRGLLGDATAEMRFHRCAPLLKLYILNGEEAFLDRDAMPAAIRQRDAGRTCCSVAGVRGGGVVRREPFVW